MASYKLYNIGDLIDKTLYASNDIDIYTNKPVKYGLQPVGKVHAGNPVGVLYSWVTDDDGTILFQFMGANSNYANTLGSYFTKYDATDYDVEALKQQGILSIDEQLAAEAEEKRKANLTLADRAEEILKYGILAFVGVALVKAFLNKTSK